MFWIEILPAAIFFLALLFIPESPRYLMVKNRRDDAEKVLTKLYGPAEAQLKLREIGDSLSD